ncbi:MAG: hypothetical protein ACFNVO_07920 [Prevotella sp.]
MKTIKLLALVAMLLMPLLLRAQDVQGPCYVVDGRTYAFVSSTSKQVVEKELSEYIARNLPIIQYDNSSFRFVVSATIGKEGEIKRLRLVNKKSFKGNMSAWEDVKKLLNAVQFKPVMYGGKAISYSFVFQIKVDFTT